MELNPSSVTLGGKHGNKFCCLGSNKKMWNKICSKKTSFAFKAASLLFDFRRNFCSNFCQLLRSDAETASLTFYEQNIREQAKYLLKNV